MGAHIADGEAAVWDGHVQASFLPDEDGVGEALLLYVLQAQLQDKQLQLYKINIAENYSCSVMVQLCGKPPVS